MINKKIGFLLIEKEIDNHNYLVKIRSKCFLCKCSCGRKIIFTSTDLKTTNPDKLHCGCKHPKHKEMIGLKFGQVSPLLKTLPTNKAVNYLCRCDCGNLCNISLKALETDNYPHCGCAIVREFIKRY